MWFQKTSLTPNFITLLLFSWTFIMKPYNTVFQPNRSHVLYCFVSMLLHLLFPSPRSQPGAILLPHTQYLLMTSRQFWLSPTAGGCYWHPVGRGMLVNILQYTGQSSRQRITQSKTVLRLKDPGLDKSFALRCVHMLTILDDVF